MSKLETLIHAVAQSGKFDDALILADYMEESGDAEMAGMIRDHTEDAVLGVQCVSLFLLKGGLPKLGLEDYANK